ncbi:MAG: MarR family transcriptional regulator [Ignavibacteria bacterium]|jgi:DNA-binding MarR family transcriptional regulator|nr:MarR family transcriptional regulator [Ignavibacteria bacterium]MDH7528894.1 MarR family transcriptional regulator [Ignavibacteria bacterium]NPV11362.1 MarR family transcriptional regulator [Ignavibacteria bacterium]
MSKNQETEAIINELMELGYKLREVMFKLNPTIFKSELTLTQLFALQYICHIPNITLKELADKLVIAQSSASELVDRLVTMKYVDRKISPEDRRKIILNLSPKGKKFIEQHIEENKSLFKKLISKLSPEEQREYLSAMQKFYKVSLELVNQIEKGEI